MIFSLCLFAEPRDTAVMFLINVSKSKWYTDLCWFTTHCGSNIRTVALRIINTEQLVMVDLMLLFGSDE